MPATPVHHTPTVDEPWDGPAAVAAMPAAYATLYACHAWWSDDAASESGSHDASPAGDGDPDDKKSNYKFPHHKTKGGPANVAACQNGLARLSGASIPDSDVAGVKAHLQAHLDDANKGKSDNKWRSDVHNLKMARPIARMEQARKWYRIENSVQTGQPADVYIYDEISWFGVMAQEFANDLRSITAPSINLHINSPGGDVFDGIAIMQALKDHPANVTVYVDSLAASIASVIAMAGDKVIMAPSATMMIHDGLSMVIGNAADMRKQADVLDKISDTIAGVYAAKTGLDQDLWRMAMQEETWYTAQEAVAAGLADEVSSDKPDDAVDEKIAAKWDLSIFAHAGRKNAPAPKIHNADGTPYKPQPYEKEADETVQCPSCQKYNDTDAAYCDQCGEKLTGNPDVKARLTDATPEGGDQCPNCKQFNPQGASSCSECGEDMPDQGKPDDKATPPQPDEDAGSPNKTPSKEEEETEPNPSKKRVPTSAQLDWDEISTQFDPEIFRSAIADIGKL